MTQWNGSSASVASTIGPGSRIGVFGGGQLGRMLAQAAQRLGYQVVVYYPEVNGPAHQVVSESYSRDFADLDSVRQFAKSVDVITLEFENIPASTVEEASRWCPVRPGAAILAMAQHRLKEKSTLRDWGLPVTPFREVSGSGSIEKIGGELGWPLVLKTATSGYDGKGQRKVHSLGEAKICLEEFGEVEVIAEQLIDLEVEVSAIVARNPRGEVAVYPLFMNEHFNHILDVTCCPVPSRWKSLESQATEIAHEIADKMTLEGLLCIEFFIDTKGSLMINEIAPRPHNSGHLTLEACRTNQFEQQLRAVCNLPLGEVTLISPSAAMANLLGDVWIERKPRFEIALSNPMASLHLYGKSEPKPGRKMGHLTLLAQSQQEATEGVRRLRSQIKGEL